MDLIIRLTHRTIVIIKPPVKEEKNRFSVKTRIIRYKTSSFCIVQWSKTWMNVSIIQKFPIKHASQMCHKAASFSTNSAFQCGFISAKRTQAQPQSQNSCKTTDFFLKISIDSTAYLVRTLLGPQVDKRISWVCEINYSGNLKAGRLNKIPVALQTKGSNYSLKTSNNCNNKASGKGRKKIRFSVKTRIITYKTSSFCTVQWSKTWINVSNI